ncbi:MAG: hypothetical protein D3915_04700 [Candidatus Electrothrix sp. AU1_5]|nr:hypothetical protein [Candidatus Electrothrix gigas]MCI5226544.1 hypothetical protein [Candidatus Electrothrix gigas]
MTPPTLFSMKVAGEATKLPVIFHLFLLWPVDQDRVYSDHKIKKVLIITYSVSRARFCPSESEQEGTFLYRKF